MEIRKANQTDAHAIYNVHIASIKHSCSGSYPKHSIDAWVASKSPDFYRNLNDSSVLIVAQEADHITGFGLLNLCDKSIESLYLDPMWLGRGIGRILLMEFEQIAIDYSIDTLKVSSTLNAIGFYHRMGYAGDKKKTHTLRSGAMLECVDMTKKVL